MGRTLRGIFYDGTRTKFQLGNECYQVEGRVTFWAAGQGFLKKPADFSPAGYFAFRGLYPSWNSVCAARREEPSRTNTTPSKEDMVRDQYQVHFSLIVDITSPLWD